MVPSVQSAFDNYFAMFIDSYLFLEWYLFYQSITLLENYEVLVLMSGSFSVCGKIKYSFPSTLSYFH